MRQHSYQFSEAEFVKGGLENLPCEVEKAQRIFDIASEYGFVAPRVVGSSLATSTIHLERIHGLRSYRDLYLAYMSKSQSSTQALEITEKVGIALAQIHRDLVLSNFSEWEPPERFLSLATHRWGHELIDALRVAPQAYLHGDFGFSNVCLVGEASETRIVVIDPSANGFMTTRSDISGPVYIDLANFLSCLEGLVPLRCQLRLRWRRLNDLKRAFIESYKSESGLSLDMRVLERMTYLTAATYLRYRFRVPILSRIALFLLFNPLKGNVPK